MFTLFIYVAMVYITLCMISSGMYIRKIILSPKDIERFWGKIEKTDYCWLYKGGKYKFGYGQFHIKRVGYYAHRISYQLLVGNIPSGKVLDHLCRNPSCVNPDHLQVVSIKENTLRGNNHVSSYIKRTHCPKGHVLSGSNLIYRKSDNSRYCRMCISYYNKHLRPK